MDAAAHHRPPPDRQTPAAMLCEIQRLSTEDGPGIRTTIFFKGCSLACAWCHNPESIAPHPQLHWLAGRCIGCGSCDALCPAGALRRTPDGVAIDRGRCDACGLCAAECPATALEIIGTPWTLDALCREVLKDRAYFGADGGVTAGGGEPGLQAPFLAAWLRRMQQAGVHTAVDTCGAYPRQTLEAFLPFTDLVLYDIKAIDPEDHRRFTGRSNAQILANLQYIGQRLAGGGPPSELWIRTPVIPAATATEANIDGIGRWIAAHLKGAVQRWELCAFNNLCADKYRRLDRAWAYDGQPLLAPSLMARLAATARNSGVDPAIVHCSGATRIEDERRTDLDDPQVNAAPS